MPRTIIHLDLDAFFCAVEEQRDPLLTGRPFAVGGSAEARGVISTCSYAARRFGVHSAMPTAQALRLCPRLLLLPPRFAAYSAASRGVMARLRALTPLVEQISIDEAFFDATALAEPGETVARRVQAAIRDELGLPCSLGVAANKLVAKIATDVGKSAVLSDGPPNAVQVVPPGEEAAFLAPLTVGALWGVGPKTAARLHELGMQTIGDIARWPEADLVRRFGKMGGELSWRARGIDDRPIVTYRAAKSISKETTFAHDLRDEPTLRAELESLARGVGEQLRHSGLRGSTVKLKLRWPDFTTVSRQASLHLPTDRDGVITAASLRLFDAVWASGRPVRLLGVGVSSLEPTGTPRLRQLCLWDPDAELEGM
jgi:DNA polymerase IV